jgi:hypothetical protein
MTISEIIEELRPHKAVTKQTVYSYFKRLKIKPIGRTRQIPQHYPENTGKRVLAYLGYKVSPARIRTHTVAEKPPRPAFLKPAKSSQSITKKNPSVAEAQRQNQETFAALGTFKKSLQKHGMLAK